MADERIVEVLGPIRALVGGAPVHLRGVTSRTVLARLALAGGRPVSEDALYDALWDDPPSRPRAALQTTISRLRTVLGADAIVRVGAGYALDQVAVAVDLGIVEGLVTAADDAVGTGDRSRSIALLDEALARWRGDALADVAPTAAMLPHRVRLDELAAVLRERRHELMLDEGRVAEVLPELEHDASANPLRETAVLLLMRAFGMLGRSAEAMRAAADHRRVLADTTGLEPTSALAAAERLVLEGGVDLRPAPARVVPAGRRGNRSWMPPDDDLVGRDETLAEAVALLKERRLLTIVGPGGVGKTRLAMELVDRHLTGDVFVVELSSLDRSEGDEVLTAVAGELGLQSGDVDLLVAVAQRLDLFGATLVLDNAEHVLDSVRALVDQLLRRAPNLSVVVTSRRRIGLGHEQLLPLAPLPVPDRPSVDEPAVRLLLDRIGRHDPAWTGTDHLEDVTEIVRLVDGLPLALELAAARIPLLGLEELRRRLADGLAVLSPAGRTARETLDVAIGWSLDLLRPSEREALARLAVFPGRFAADAAEAVVGGGDPLGALVELAASSLVVVETGPGGPRYRLLAPIRDAVRRVVGTDEDATRAHASWVCRLGAEIERRWNDDDDRGTAAMVFEHRADLVAALRHLHAGERQGDADLLCRRVALVLLEHPDIGLATLIPDVTGPGIDGVIARALNATSVGRPAPEEVDALRAAMVQMDAGDERRHLLRYASAPSQMYQGDVDGALAACRALLDDGEAPPRIAALGAALWALAETYMGRPAAADAVLRRYDELLRWSDLGGFVAYVRAEAAMASNREAALAHVEEAVELAERHGSAYVTASAEALRLSLLYHSGRHDQAWSVAWRLTPWLLAAGTMPQAWRALRITAHLLLERGDAETAALVLAVDEHDPRAPVVLEGWVAFIERQWRRINAELGEAAVERIRSTAAGLTVTELWSEVARAGARLGVSPG